MVHALLRSLILNKYKEKEKVLLLLVNRFSVGYFFIRKLIPRRAYITIENHGQLNQK
jgi:hypothetical protein